MGAVNELPAGIRPLPLLTSSLQPQFSKMVILVGEKLILSAPPGKSSPAGSCRPLPAYPASGGLQVTGPGAPLPTRSPASVRLKGTGELVGLAPLWPEAQTERVSGNNRAKERTV